MTEPFSRTRIGNCGSMRRARAAALRPAATPPMTTNAIRRLFLFPHSLHEVQNVERLDLPVGVVTADGVLLVGKDFEDSRELGHDQKLDIAPVQVEELHIASSLAQAGGANDQSSEAGAVDE